MIAHLGAVGNGKDSRNDDGEEPAMRSGFDNHFLGVLSPLPGAGGRSVTRVDYVHSTVVLDRDRRLALTSAVNINGAELREIEREDEWRYDPRIPETLQVGEEVYADNHLDRGHLVRRRDPVWGSAVRAAISRMGTRTSFSNRASDPWVHVSKPVTFFGSSNPPHLRAGTVN
ncbi:MAG: DNA/RNA non-specific endonuclease [Ornithinimicrobium sp.]